MQFPAKFQSGTMRIFGLLLSLALWALPAQAALAEPPSIEAFQERCEEKGGVYSIVDGELILTAESINDYCAGFLEGVLALLQDEEHVCADRKYRTPYALRSVVNFYVRDNPSEGLDASVVVAQAFKRAFPCDND